MGGVYRNVHQFLSAGLLLAMLTPAAEAQSTPATLPSRGPVIGTLDFYGLRKVPEAKVRQALGVHEGDLLPPSKGDIEERLDALPGVVQAHLEAICCENGKIILYTGIEERGAPHFDLHEVPDGDAALPSEIDSAYRRFLEAYGEAARFGYTKEDLTKGYARSEDVTTRAIQEMFPSLVADHLAELRATLRNSSDEEQRATAAYVIGYAADQKSVVNDLQYALRDADPGVRVNAARSLIAFAGAGIKVEPTWFIEMLNSLSWTDRTRALAALQILTDARNPAVLDQLRERALPALVEMARWRTLSHALPAYVLLGRITGLSEKQIQDAWSGANRESVVTEAAKLEKPEKPEK
jgi:HEAT repeats